MYLIRLNVSISEYITIFIIIYYTGNKMFVYYIYSCYVSQQLKSQ